jgi:hypothetical protein
VRRFVVAGSALLLAACGGGDPPVPTAAVVTAGASITSTVASVVTDIPAVRITDAKGKGVKNVMVRWRVTSGGGKVTVDSVRTSASGDASSGGWTLGTAAGTQTLQASADGVPTVTFTAVAAPGPVSRLVAVSATTQDAPVDAEVTIRPSVRAEDVFGNPVPNVAVSFSVTQGGGTVTGEVQTTNAQGIATVTSWRLGTTAGQQILRATALNATAAIFTANALPGPAADLVKIAGDGQQGISGLAVSIQPGVRVVDAFGNPVGNVPVTFTPGAGSGTVLGATVASDPANGSAFVGSWILGTAPTQTLVATSTQIPGKSVTFTATVAASLYDIDVRFVGSGGTAVVRNAFITAAAKWRSIVVGDVHNTRLATTAGTCASWIPALDEVANDVVIYARIAPIDGAGSILGQAGPCLINSATRLASVGVMEFDEDDMASLIANGTLADVIIHEMGHVLGIGTLWNNGRTLLVGAGTADPFFQGAAGRAGFAAINTVTYSGNAVPVENTGGAGTRDSHWRESVLGRELMTGFLNRNVANPLSRLTVGSLQDLGYLVNINASDAYTITAALRYSFPFVQDEVVSLHGDVMDIPLYMVQPSGALVMMRASLRTP